MIRTGGPGTGSPHDLLRDLAGLAALLAHEVAAQSDSLAAGGQASWLNGYLIAAGISQVAQDHLHRDPFSSRKVARHLASALGPIGRATSAVVGAGGTAVESMRVLHRGERRLQEVAARASELAIDLARAYVGGTGSKIEPSALVSTADRVIAAVGQLPAAGRREVLRLPATFRSFDQYPDDIRWLAEELGSRWPDHSRRLLVVGIRTSGSYLAPLCAAYLESLGYRDVSVVTPRPSERWRAADNARVAKISRQGGAAVIVDDPPGGGETVAGVARLLERRGFDRRAIVPLLQLFGEADEVPEPLRAYPAIVLPFSRWRVHRLLDPENVQAALGVLFGDPDVVSSVRRVGHSTHPRRGHVEAEYEVSGRSWPNGGRVKVRGVGIGLFGEQALEVARRLAGSVPATYGLMDGLLYQEMPPHERGLKGAHELGAPVARAIARHSQTRRRRLAVAEDMSLRLDGRNPVWQRASDILAAGFGRTAPAARFPLHGLARRLLSSQRPSVVDGNTAISRWFAREDDPSDLVKVGAETHAFSNRDLYCYDAVYDLAGAAASVEDPSFGRELRQAWLELTGEKVSNERWLLYELVHLFETKLLMGDGPAVAQRLDRRMQRYLEGLIFAHVAIPRTGPLCAIDVDGVLETPRLGFSAISPAAAVALRSLSLHGYRPVLVTGRSAQDVRDRCESYHLAGGSAEYGAVVYDRVAGTSRCLLTDLEAKHLSRLRDALRAQPGVLIDAAFSGIVRAYRIDLGRMRALDAGTVQAALEASGTTGRVRLVPGHSQTDLVPARIDKAVGLAALAIQLAGEVEPSERVRFAMGDTVSDIPMFGLAQAAFVPSNADSGARVVGARVTRRPFGAGVSDAARVVLGHAPGGCPTCRRPAPAGSAAALMTALSALDQDGRTRLLTVLRVWVELLSVPRPAAGTPVPAPPAPPIDALRTTG